MDVTCKAFEEGLGYTGKTYMHSIHIYVRDDEYPVVSKFGKLNTHFASSFFGLCFLSFSFFNQYMFSQC